MSAIPLHLPEAIRILDLEQQQSPFEVVEGFYGPVHQFCAVVAVNQVMKTIFRLHKKDEDKYQQFMEEFNELMSKYAPEKKETAE